jgi:hypothetical protein
MLATGDHLNGLESHLRLKVREVLSVRRMRAINVLPQRVCDVGECYRCGLLES